MYKLLTISFFLLLTFNLPAQHKGFDIKAKKDIPGNVTGSDYPVVKGTAKEGVSRTTSGKPVRRTFATPDKNQGAEISSLDSLNIIKGVDGLPKLINVKRNGVLLRNPANGISKDSLSKKFLNELKPQLKFSNKIEFVMTHASDGMAKLKQTYKGVDFYGKEVVLHFNGNGEGTSFAGIYATGNFDVSTEAKLDPNSCLQAVLTDLKNKTIIRELSESEKHFYHYEGPILRKVIFETDDFATRLAYEVELKPNVLETWRYIVDANDGNILRAYSILCSVDGPHTATAQDLNGVSRTINTYLEGSSYKLINTTKPMFKPATQEGIIITLDAKNTPASQFAEITSSNNTWSDKAGVSAHYNAGIAYDYFYNRHGRNSINGQGGDIISFVNVSDDAGQGLDNAYWNGQAIFYGNGQTYFYPLARSLDVAGHEMTHGVVQNTANLEYYSESGAINESMADIFGCMMDSTDWQIGEEVVKTAFYPSGALRDLQDPHNGGSSLADDGYQPKHVNEKYNGSQDNRGVHINSGIPNHAFYLLATSTARWKASRIFYRALSMYLTRYSEFTDLRIACVQSAKDLFGAAAPEVTFTEQAFDAVGIVGGTTSVVSTTIPVNPGQDYLLTVDTYSFDAISLYRSSASGTGFIGLSDTEIKSHPSVTDNGTKAYYVGEDDRIYSLDLTNVANPVETVVDARAIWGYVAVSKDGSRIAATTNDQDSSIFIYDFNLQDWRKFKLYNPTFSPGIKSGGPIYADALEWDYTGEYLVYDAFNVLQNTSGQDIEYWDVNFIRVWDKQANTFGDGDIEKLFASLPAGVSIGNPTYSKNSPYIIAFDYFNETEDEYMVVGFDMENNDQGIILYNNYLAWPSYNKFDDQIAYTTLYLDGEDVAEGVRFSGVHSNKVTGVGGASSIIPYAKFPVFYSMGTRNIIISDVKDKVSSDHVNAYPNPFEDSFSLISRESKMKEVHIYDSRGTVIQVQKPDSFEEKVNALHLPSGIYLIKVLTENGYQTFKMIKK